MRAKEFIKKELKQIHSIFPFLHIKYEFDELAITHIIHITPSSFFEENLEFAKVEMDLMHRFLKRFPEEDILFTDENSLNPEYSFGAEGQI